MSSTLESYELIRFAEAFEARLAAAGEMLTGRPGLDAEKGWLATALELVRTARAPTAGVLDRVKDLPELEEAREEYAFHQQGLWVDALEKLHAGITFTASSRAPVIEALFPHLKFPQLRRAPREAVLEYATSYERRTKSAYVTRIFAREDFALVRPVMEQVLAAHTAWRTSHEPAPLTQEQENLLREELVTLGRKLDQSLRQARLLAEAALVPVPTVYEAAGLHLKPKRRAGRGLSLADDTLAGLEEPVDSMEPTEAELAEVAALDAGGDIAPHDAAAPSAPSNVAAAADTGAGGVEASADNDRSVDSTDAHRGASAGAAESASESRGASTGTAESASESRAPSAGAAESAGKNLDASPRRAGSDSTADTGSVGGDDTVRGNSAEAAPGSEPAVTDQGRKGDSAKTDGGEDVGAAASAAIENGPGETRAPREGAPGQAPRTTRGGRKKVDAAEPASVEAAGDTQASPAREQAVAGEPALPKAGSLSESEAQASRARRKADAARPGSPDAEDAPAGETQASRPRKKADAANTVPAEPTATSEAPRGRKKPDAAAPVSPDSGEGAPASEAQAPRVRKKKPPTQSAPSTPGAETP
ncbi:hypothetical protein [Myxococcus sp. Y35]|uniref:hypothetical protein n=1 Tax=Pseudomyxococcus flavus TaxID=3115648 RepID=UPI003CF46EE9